MKPPGPGLDRRIVRHLLAGFFLPALLLFAACDKGEYEVDLQYRDANSGMAMPYAMPQKLDLVLADSMEVALHLPELNSQFPLVAQIQLGNIARPMYLLFDKSNPRSIYYDMLYVDLNRDANFRNDGPPHTTKGQFIKNRNRHYVEFDRIALPYEWQLDDMLVEEPFLCKIYFWYDGSSPPASARLIRQCWRQGTFEYEGIQALVLLADDDCNGIYDINDHWALLPADSAGSKYVASLEQFREATRYGWLGETPFELAHIEARGNRVRLRRLKLDITREEDLARDNPYPGEPRRPQAAREIRWETHYRTALKKARRTRKPILLHFTTVWCGPCKIMEERTYRDAETVSLSDQFVCVKIDGDHERALVKQYKIMSYPSVVILDYRGREKGRAVGYQPAEEFSAFLRSNLRKKP